MSDTESKSEWISPAGPDSAKNGMVSAAGVKSFPSSKRSKLSKKERKKRKLRKLEARMLIARKKEMEEFMQYACKAFDEMLAVNVNIRKTLDKIDSCLDDIEESLGVLLDDKASLCL